MCKMIMFKSKYLSIIETVNILIPANASKINKCAVGRNAEYMNCLLLNGQNSERSTVEINTLIV